MATVPISAQQLEAIPLEILRTIPAEAPPPGVIPNFTHPSNIIAEVIIVTSLFLVIALTCWAIRIYSKIKIYKKWSWDDLTITGGFACAIVILGFFFNGTVNGSCARHQWEMHLDRMLSRPALEQAYYTVVFTQPALGLIKGSFFIQYYNLFHRLRWMRIAIWIGATIHCLFYTVLTVLVFVLASPWPGENLLTGGISWHYLKMQQVSVPTGAIGLAIDTFLFVLPIPAIVKLQMSTAKKIGVLAIFTTGGLAIVASAVALVYRVRLEVNPKDTTWKVAYVLMCTQVEMFAGVTVNSMPSVKGFYKHFSHRPISRPSITSFTRFLRRSTEQKDDDKSDNSSTDYRYSDTNQAIESQPKTEVSQIRVTKNYSIVREP